MERRGGTTGTTVNKIGINTQTGKIYIDYNSVTAIQYDKFLSRYRVLIYVKGKPEPFDITLEEKDLIELLANVGLPKLEKENKDDDDT